MTLKARGWEMRCDGDGCGTVVYTTVPDSEGAAKQQVPRSENWMAIGDQHYCPACAARLLKGAAVVADIAEKGRRCRGNNPEGTTLDEPLRLGRRWEEPLRFGGCEVAIGESHTIIRYPDGAIELHDNDAWDMSTRMDGPTGSWLGSVGGRLLIYDGRTLFLCAPMTNQQIVIYQ